MSGAPPTFSDAMVQQIREADDFDGLAGAFASFYGFNITDVGEAGGGIGFGKTHRA